MGIKEIDLYHGAVLFRLANSQVSLSITPASFDSRGIYLINNRVPIYIKHTAKRTSPWSFTFSEAHQNDLLVAKKQFGAAYVVFVCGHDGICCLEFDQFKQVLDHVHERAEWVRIRRGKKESYSISGSDGKYKAKVSDSDFPAVILEELKLQNNALEVEKKFRPEASGESIKI